MYGSTRNARSRCSLPTNHGHGWRCWLPRIEVLETRGHNEDGFLHLTDRSTFMIISRGVNIYPQECEDLLITHPKVADAAVFGVPNADLGEEAIQLMPGIAPGPRSKPN